ncbi:UNVERIFIED_CONTAM: hypothetical protein FKN15_049876 [Acipenser sinensis]
MDRNALAELLQALESRRDAEERRREERYTALIERAQLTATTPALTREGEDEHMLSSEACAVSRPLFFTLRTHHAATQELQHRRTTQLSGSLQASPQAPGQTTGVAGARGAEDTLAKLIKDAPQTLNF